EAESLLEPYVANWSMRKFLLTNLARSEDGVGFRWLVNLDAIVASRSEIEGSPLVGGDRFEGDVLFLMGGKSSYFVRDKVDTIRIPFPAAALKVIADSGHNPHFETRESFVDELYSFLGE
ncbi:MAG: alpha/beta hydrolase, partial [Verrucomicrobiota bacterium]